MKNKQGGRVVAAKAAATSTSKPRKGVPLRPVKVAFSDWASAQEKALLDIERSERITQRDLSIRINA